MLINFSIISLVNNDFHAFRLIAWPVNMRHINCLLVGNFSKCMAVNKCGFDVLYFWRN